MKNILFSTILLVSFSTIEAADLADFTKRSDAFFSKYVNNGLVAYKDIKANSAQINSLYSDIESMSLANASNDQKKAFYINAYNLIVIYQVAKFYPLKSPLDQSGFFDKVKHKVAGESLTLNHLEIKKLLLPYKDARIHFALACAAKSCPPLASFAYTPDKLDQQLKQRTAEAINNKDWLKVKDNKVLISKIFDWYKKDFTQTGMSVLEWINQYRNQKIPSGYSLGYYEYNWSLNEG